MIQKMKVTRLLVFMALSLVLVVSSLLIPNEVAQAAAKKTAISSTTMTIPVGKLTNKVYWNKNSWELINAQKLSVTNAVKGATYQFTSSNSKVVTVSKTGGYLTGVKAGSATITCTQTYKSKKTTVGKCKVTVKNAGLAVSEYGNQFAVGNNGFDLSSYYAGEDALFQITYRNPNATYTLSSSSKNFTIKEVKYDASKAKTITSNKEYEQVLKDHIGKAYFYGYQFTASEPGTYTVTVKETYNKKSKTIGSFKVVVKATSISEPNVDLLLRNEVDVLRLIDYRRADTGYYFSIKDFDETNTENNVLLLKQDGEDLYLYGNKTGTAEVVVREGGEEGTIIGTVTVTVSEVSCESIIVEEEYTAYIDYFFNIYYDLEPWDTTDKVTIESDNPEVLKVEYNNEEELWIYTPVKVGEANVVIKCGNQSVTCKVIVEEL